MAKQVSTIEQVGEAGRGVHDSGDLSESDRVILESATGVAQPEHEEDEDPSMAAATAAAYLDFASMPANGDESQQNNLGYDETVDGLSDIEEATRQQAEDRIPGDDEDYVA